MNVESNNFIPLAQVAIHNPDLQAAVAKGTTNAHVRMNISSLNATIYVDDFAFQAGAPAAPTNTPTTTAASSHNQSRGRDCGRRTTGWTEPGFTGKYARTGAFGGRPPAEHPTAAP